MSKIHESDEAFRTAFTYAVMAMAVMELDGQFVRVNRALCAMLGYSEAELLEMKYTEITHPDDLDRCIALMALVTKGEVESFQEQKRYVRRDGDVVWAEVSVGLVRDSEGRPAQLIGNVQNITERRRAEDALRASEQRFRSLLANIPEIVWTADAAGRAIFISPNIERVYGFTQEDIYRDGERLWFGRIHEEDRAAVILAYNRLFTDGVAFDVEYRIRHRNGAWRWWHDRALATFEREGVQYADGLLADVTERKQSADALRASEARFAAAFSANPVPSAITDISTGTILDVNEALLQGFGFARDDIVGHSSVELGLWPRAEDREKLMARIADEGRLRGFEAEVRAKSGEQRTVLLSAEAIVVDGRRCALVAAIDITDYRRAEQALRESEERLRHAQKMEAIGRLAGGVAHDFNNLLTVVTGYSELMLAKLGPGERLRDEAEEIRNAASRATALTRQLLAFGRKQILQPKVVSLNALVSDMHRMLDRLIGEDVELVIDLDPTLPDVFADAAQLEQVIANLVVNARDAMPDGGRLTISTRSAELAVAASGPDPGAYAVLAVTDTGVGMDDETMRHVFEPFFTTKTTGQGTGLGLSTVYGIVAQSRGHVEVESAPGRGATFRVFLPAALARAPAPQARPEPAPPRGGSETVLLVEDEPSVRRLAATTLRQCGYEVIECEDATIALRTCEETARSIALVVTDVVMPGMSGRQLAEALRVSRPETKVLYISGYTEDDVLRRGVSERREKFLAKPFTPDGLARKVREVIDGD